MKKKFTSVKFKQPCYISLEGIAQKCESLIVLIFLSAAPTALLSHGIAKGKMLTSHPAVKEKMEADGNYKYSEDSVVKDGTLITSRGPGTAFNFALALVEALKGKEVADSLVSPMILKV